LEENKNYIDVAQISQSSYHVNTFPFNPVIRIVVLSNCALLAKLAMGAVQYVSGQWFWLQIQRARFDARRYHIF
jgi:hypothetical protein